MLTTLRKAGALILSRENPNDILLLYRGHQRDWSFPKGKLEANETPLTAMRREVLEETGLSVEVLSELPAFHYLHHSGTAIELFLFLCRSMDDSALRREHSGDQLSWHTVPEALTLITQENLRDYLSTCAHNWDH